jgi:hypothetical protein
MNQTNRRVSTATTRDYLHRGRLLHPMVPYIHSSKNFFGMRAYRYCKSCFAQPLHCRLRSQRRRTHFGKSETTGREKRRLTPSLTVPTCYFERLEKRASLPARKADLIDTLCRLTGRDTPGSSHCTRPAGSHALSSDSPWPLPTRLLFRGFPRKARSDSYIRDTAPPSVGSFRGNGPR